MIPSAMPRSVKVRPCGIEQVKLAVRGNGFSSQRALAEEVGFGLATVSNFLTGKPVDYITKEKLPTLKQWIINHHCRLITLIGIGCISYL